MHHKIIKVFAYFVLSFLLMTCDPYSQFPAGKVQGYRPVYASSIDAAITFAEAQPVKKPGKIYIYGKYLFVNEQNEGIHIFDNSNPTLPQALGFLKIYGNVDMVVRNHILYVDHIGNLVALDIVDLNNIKELSRIKTWSYDLPPSSGKYFECVNPDKGEIIGWELATLNNPECYR